MADSPGWLARLSERAFWTTAVALLVALRVPRLVSPNHVLDGDEAILGLMARHLARGEAVPLFFQGQAYGLSLLEVAAAAAAFRLPWAAPTVLPLAMLTLFLIGLWAWERALRQLTGDRAWSRTLVLALGLLPVWIVWSMKARGGYLTAFVLAGVVLALVTGRPRSGEPFSAGRAVIAGALTGVLFQAQPLWLPPVLPFLLLPALRGAPWRRVGLAVGAGAAVALLLGTGAGQREAWEPAVLLGFSPVHALLLPERLYRMFTGFFLLGDAYRPTGPVATVAAGATTAFAGTLLVLLVHAVRRRAPLAAVAGLSLAWCVAPVVLLRDLPPRYLLQSAAFLFMGVAALVGGRGAQPAGAEGEASGTARAARAGGAAPGRPARGPAALPGRAFALVTCALFVVLAASAVSVRHLRTHARESRSDVEEELRRLTLAFRTNRVEGAYALHGLLQWQILFYGDEEVPVRSRRTGDRFPEYGARVDAALRAGGRTVVVGPVRTAPDAAIAELVGGIHLVGTDYFVLPDPPRALLEALEFGFEAPDGGGAGAP